MGYKRRSWDELKSDTQARYRRAGIGPKEHAAGAQMQPGRRLTEEQKKQYAARRRARKHQRQGMGI